MLSNYVRLTEEALWVLGRSPPQPRVRVALPMNDAHKADRRGKDLVVNGVWEAPQQHPSKTAPNDGVTLGRFLDKADRGINRVEELLRRRQ